MKYYRFILFAYSVILRYPILNIPFERDEGEFAYFGQLILKGIAPFQFEGNMKLPGAYFFYALVMKLFGDGLISIHLSLIVINLISSILIYKISQFFIKNKNISLICSMIYLTLAAHHTVLGFALHATQILTPFILGSLILLLQNEQRVSYRKLFFSGLLFGIAMIIKQPALLFGVMFLYLLDKNITGVITRVVIVLSGILLPFTILISWVLINNVEDNFYRWTVEYAMEYGKYQSPRQILDNIGVNTLHVIGEHWLIWISACFGLPILIKSIKSYKLLILFVGGSILSIVPGFFFRPHYFIMLLPAIGLLTGLLLQYLEIKINDKTKNIFAAILAASFIFTPFYNYSKSNIEILRDEYQIAPFSESLKIGNYIDSITEPPDRILVFGSEPQIYYYSKRRAACSFMYFWPFVEDHSLNKSMQLQAISEIDSIQPRLIVFTQEVSWDLNYKCPKDLFNWTDEYIKNYTKIALIDVFPTKNTEYSWEIEGHDLEPRSNYSLSIYVRKN